MAVDTQALLEPVITLRYDRSDDGTTWFAQLTVSGIPTEVQANSVLDHMQRLFCGEELGGPNDQ